MRRDGWKWAALGGLIVLAIMYGMEVASSGIGRIYGPIEQAGAVTGDTSGARTPAQERNAGQDVRGQQDFGTVASAPPQRNAGAGDGGGMLPAEDGALTRSGQAADPLSGGIEEPAGGGEDGTGIVPVLPAHSREPSVNRIADSASGLLQEVSSGGIRLVVHLFGALTG